MSRGCKEEGEEERGRREEGERRGSDKELKTRRMILKIEM